ncbi:helix-turn-helix domain-containing protein [Winogradskyella sp.]|uniref:helix-turn-helix domain-containing protein n=1 Tax=Winogradskyella sp. TaxID=1883156 RepID=UPI003BAD9A66
MINTTITHIIATVTVILLFLFMLYLLSNKKRSLRHSLLAIFFLANGLYLIDYLLNPIQRVLGISLAWFDEVGFSFAFLFGPLILFFIRSILTQKLELKLNMIWHIIPFIFFFIVYIISDNIFCEYGYIILFIQLFIYYALALNDLILYRSKAKLFLSNLADVNLNWVVYVLIAFIMTSLIDFTSAILAFFHLDNATTRANLNFFSVLINFSYVVYIFYNLLNLPELSFENNDSFHAEKYTASKLTQEMKARIVQKVEDYFSNEKPYINPALTINDISQALEIPMRDISQVINESLNKNFYDFTNSYRINEAKAYLTNEAHHKETILEILYKSGFNSKSSFNTAFKKNTGQTPSQYRQSKRF